MRILWVTTAASFDGPGRVLSALLKHWPAGDCLTVCALETATPDFRRDLPAGVALHELRARGRWDLRAATRLVTLCRAERPDLIHTQLSRADWIGRVVGRLLRVPVVSTIQNLHGRMYAAEFSPPFARAGVALDRLTTPFVSRFIAVSSGVRADLERAGVAREKIAVIHNAIDVDRTTQLLPRASVRNVWGCSDADIVVGTIAHLRAQKGISFLIRAAERIVPSRPCVRFIHIGGGPLSRESRAQVDDAGLSAHFQFLNHVDDPMTLLSGVDLFVLPSLWEGLPVSLLEAMAAGLPCVGTRVSGTEDAIEDGASGLLVPPADAEALARALLALVDDPAQRRTLGDDARARVRSQFDAATAAARYRAVYEELLPHVRSVTTQPRVA